MIKKLALGVVGLVLFLVCAIYLWLQFPTVKDPAYFVACLILYLIWYRRSLSG